jgi:molybdate transport system substrate-binding protein
VAQSFSHARLAAAAAAALLCLGSPAAPIVVPRLGPGTGGGGEQELGVFAAASLADALSEIGAAWSASSGRRPVFNFGASSDLARQIRAGAPADVFFSADEAQMDALEREGLVRKAKRVDLLSNTLVVVVPARSTAQLKAPAELERFASLALADPQAVPAGVYARAWLERLGLWSALSPRVVPALHVRAALAAVESENVEAGIVYRTDALRSRRVRIALEVARAEGPAIVYPVAAIDSSRSASAAGAFVAYLQGPEARAVFARHGFVVLGGR